MMAVTLIAGTTSIAPQPAFAKAKAAKFADDCAVHRKPFAKIKNYRTNQMLKGALKGALAGLVTGLAVNALTPDEYYYDKQGRLVKKSKSVLPWVLAGAVGGGVAGYVASRSKAAANREELQALIAADYSKDVQTFSPLAQQLADLGNCRRTQILRVQVQHESGQINAAEGKKRLTLIQKWLAQDDKLISAAAKKQTESVSTYARAVAIADSDDPEKVGTEQEVVTRIESQSAEYAPLIHATYVTGFDPAGASAAPPPLPAVAPPSVYFVTAKSGARLRTAPSATSAILAVLPHAAAVPAKLSADGQWYEATWDGKRGYVHRDLLSATGPAVRSAGPAAPPVQAGPPPGRSVKMLRIQRTAAKPRTPRDQVRIAVSDGASVRQVRAADKAATSSALQAALQSMTT
jgi:hypothetical protein